MESKSIERDKIENRIVMLQYPANKTLEDRAHCCQLKSINGYMISVFDGHGGWQVAEYAMENIGKSMEEALDHNKEEYQDKDQEEYVKASISQAYDKIENSFLEVARKGYELGFSQLARVGSCALTALVSGNKLYAANLGDCKGIICSVDPQTHQIYARKINSKLNANSKKEQQRLKATFVNDQDIVTCKLGKLNACYVKSRLQPTRTLGDFHLKLAEFNNPKNHTPEEGFPPRIAQYNGPYISKTPEIRVMNLRPEDRYLILGCDGLWDELNANQISLIVQTHLDNPNQILESIFNNSLSNAAQRHKISEAQLKALPLGIRRKFHDDITIIVLDLQN